MTAGERIRQIRRAVGLTQSKFAERVGISTSYVAEIELGKKRVNDRIFRLISTEFKVNEHWLRTGEGSESFEEQDLNIVKMTGMFKSLSPAFQECALEQLDALMGLYRKTKMCISSGEIAKNI